MKSTPNYNLIKQELTDAADIMQISQNWDKIDTELNRQKVVDENLTAEIKRVDEASADLDSDGRLKASQMRFDAEQTLYVDANVASSGDGSEASPFKTIQEAVNARYRGAPVIYLKIKAGTYAEAVNIQRSPNTTWRLERNGTGTVSVGTLLADNCAYVVFDGLTFNLQDATNDGLFIANCPTVSFNDVVVNGHTGMTGINLVTCRARLNSVTLNNCGVAVAAQNNSYVSMSAVSGTGNTRGIHANHSIVIVTDHQLQAVTPFEKINGGAINVEGGASSFPSNYSQLYSIGQFTTIDPLKAALLAEFAKLKTGESRKCWFTNSIPEGFGQFVGNQNMAAELVKSTSNGNGYGIILFHSHFNPAIGYWHVHNGQLIGEVPTAMAIQEVATPSTFGVLRVASVEDELDCSCTEAAITPQNFYSLADFRLADTEYSVGDRVECKYNFEYYLECTKAGTSSSEVMDTHGVTPNQVITDGTMEWTVRVKPKSVNGIEADTYGNVVDRIQVSIKDRDPTKPTYGL